MNNKGYWILHQPFSTSSQIRSAIDITQEESIEINGQDYFDSYLSIMISKFSTIKNYRASLHAHFKLLAYCNFRDDEGYLSIEWLRDFNVHESQFIFDEPCFKENVFIVKHGGIGAYNILKRCMGLNFYITNEEVDYIVYYDDYGSVQATGTAVAWLEEYAHRTGREVRYLEREDELPPPTIEELKKMYPDAFKYFKD